MSNKYGAIPTVVDNIKFDSLMEARYYQHLKIMLKAKLITDLELQPTFVLLGPNVTKLGKKINGIKYKADFKYKDEQGNTVIVDVKGVQTKDFIIKKKLFYDRNRDLELKLVTNKRGRWVEI